MDFMTGALLASLILGILHVSADSFSFKAQAGNAYTVGPRDTAVERTGVTGRLHRAARNYSESLVLFLVAVVRLDRSGRLGGLGPVGAWIFIGARAAYLPAYASGWPWIRTVCWQVAMVGLLVMIADLWV